MRDEQKAVYPCKGIITRKKKRKTLLAHIKHGGTSETLRQLKESKHRVPCSVRLHYMISPEQANFSSVQSLSHVQLFETPWTAARQASLSITNSRSLIKLMSIESVMPSNQFILCHPLLLPPSIFPSISLFQWVSSSNQVAKVLEFQLQHQSFQWIFSTDFL